MRPLDVLDEPVAAAPRPIFVVGYQRSGTTAMHAALCQHSRLRQAATAGKELWFLQEFFLGRQHHGNRHHHDGSDLDRAFSQEYARLVDRFCRQHLARGSQRWVLGHPDDRRFLDGIFELFPAARVVYLLRHPRESIWSSLHSQWIHLPTRAAFLERARLEAQHWLRSVPIVKKAMGNGFAGRVMVVRHEQLLAEPARIARQVLEHVGEPYEATVADELGRVKNSSFEPENSFSTTLGRRSKDAAGDPAFGRIIAEICGKELRELGYESSLHAGSAYANEEAPVDRLHAYFSRHGRRARWLAWLLGI